MTERVLIVEDDGFTRMLLASQVTQLGYQVVGAAASVNEALTVARREGPAVAIIDLDLGRGPTGMDLAYALRRDWPAVGILMLSTYLDTRLIGDQRELPSGVVSLVKRAVHDSAVLDAGIRLAIERDDDAVRRAQLAPIRMPRISGSQLEILRLVAEGYSNAEIARRRVITEAAVGKAVTRLIRQLGVTSSNADNQRVLIAQAYFQLAGTVAHRRA
jgi:DNA-binding NarL/FixJ family response regulator